MSTRVGLGLDLTRPSSYQLSFGPQHKFNLILRLSPCPQHNPKPTCTQAPSYLASASSYARSFWGEEEQRPPPALQPSTHSMEIDVNPDLPTTTIQLCTIDGRRVKVRVRAKTRLVPRSGLAPRAGSGLRDTKHVCV